MFMRKFPSYWTGLRDIFFFNLRQDSYIVLAKTQKIIHYNKQNNSDLFDLRSVCFNNLFDRLFHFSSPAVRSLVETVEMRSECKQSDWSEWLLCLKPHLSLIPTSINIREPVRELKLTAPLSVAQYPAARFCPVIAHRLNLPTVQLGWIPSQENSSSNFGPGWSGRKAAVGLYKPRQQPACKQLITLTGGPDLRCAR